MITSHQILTVPSLVRWRSPRLTCSKIRARLRFIIGTRLRLDYGAYCWKVICGIPRLNLELQGKCSREPYINEFYIDRSNILKLVVHQVAGVAAKYHDTKTM